MQSTLPMNWVVRLLSYLMINSHCALNVRFGFLCSLHSHKMSYFVVDCLYKDEHGEVFPDQWEFHTLNEAQNHIDCLILDDGIPCANITIHEVEGNLPIYEGGYLGLTATAL